MLFLDLLFLRDLITTAFLIIVFPSLVGFLNRFARQVAIKQFQIAVVVLLSSSVRKVRVFLEKLIKSSIGLVPIDRSALKFLFTNQVIDFLLDLSVTVCQSKQALTPTMFSIVVR